MNLILIVLTVCVGIGVVQLMHIYDVLVRIVDEVDKLNDKLSIVIKQRGKNEN